MGRALAETIIVQDTGEVLAKANEEITEELLVKLKSENVSKIKTIYVNDLDYGDYVSSTLRIDETPDRLSARIAIYRMMRPGEPPTEDSVRLYFNDFSLILIPMICQVLEE